MNPLPYMTNSQEKGSFYKETLFTRYKYDDGSLYGLSNDVIQGKHPVRLDVVVPQDFIYLQKHYTKSHKNLTIRKSHY